MAGAAGLVSIPAIIAACSSTTTSSAPSAAAPSTAASACGERGGAECRGQRGDRHAFRGLEPVRRRTEEGAPGRRRRVHGKETGITVKINTVDHTTFQDQLSNYLQGTPETSSRGSPAIACGSSPTQGLFTPIDDVWTKIGSNFSDAMKTAATSDDKHQYLVPFATYAWTVYYRKSLWEDKGYKVPATLDDLKTLAAKMQTDGLVPDRLGDLDGWPAQGHFDIINLRENGYDFHVDLMAGAQKWTDPKVKHVFKVWKDLLPFYQTGSVGRKWQDAAAGLVQKTTGMMLQPQVAETFTAAGAADFADLDFFPWPIYGTQWDAEKALDAPIDGYMLTAKSPTLTKNMDAAKAFLEFLGKGTTQIIMPRPTRPASPRPRTPIPARTRPLQKKPGEGHRRCPEDHPVPRSGHPVRLRRQARDAGLPAAFLQAPDQDLRRLPEEDPGLLGLARPGGVGDARKQIDCLEGDTPSDRGSTPTSPLN